MRVAIGNTPGGITAIVALTQTLRRSVKEKSGQTSRNQRNRRLTFRWIYESRGAIIEFRGPDLDPDLSVDQEKGMSRLGCVSVAAGATLILRCRSSNFQFFPQIMTAIHSNLAVSFESGRVVYIHGLLPVYEHAANDLASLRLFTSQMIATENERHSEIARTFGVCQRSCENVEI
jgi:hypothetical protein